jgi:hypothetical protein
MTVIKIDNFAGIAPRMSARLLPNNGAVAAENAKLLSGELRGLRQTQLIFDFGTFSGQTVQRAYRLPATVGAPIPMGNSDFWVGFATAAVDFVRTPVLEDSFERYYWTSDPTNYSGAPQYNTRARIQAGSTPYILGIPAPTTAATLSPPSGTAVTRSYVYTFVSAYGEEGAPSPPVTASGAATGTWALTGLQTSVPSPSHYNLITTRIYRTVASANSVDYFWVADISFGTATYNDTAQDPVVALNFTMASLTWLPPPATLMGLCVHPGGFLIGFSGRDLYMSVPYQPHAWPVQNIQTCQTEIVGVAVVNNMIMVTTTSHPYFAEGMSPDAVTLQKIDSIDPCVSRRSIATTIGGNVLPGGVYYASPQGIVLASAGTTQLVSYPLFTREEWQNFFSPTTVQAVPYGLQYIAFDNSASGFIYSPAETLAPLTTLDRFSGVQTIQIDQYTGDVYLIQNNQVRLWDPPTSTPYEYTWQSKEFDLPNPVNFGAMRLKFNGVPYNIPLNKLGDYTAFNTARYAKRPLNPINGCAINGVRVVNLGINTTLAQNSNPINGSPIFDIGGLTNPASAIQVTIFARDEDSNWNNVFSWSVTSERILRLPAGFKSDGWYVQLIGNIPVYSFAMAETGTELKKV